MGAVARTMGPRPTGTAARIKPGGEAASGMAVPSQGEIPSSFPSNSTNNFFFEVIKEDRRRGYTEMTPVCVLPNVPGSVHVKTEKLSVQIAATQIT